MSKVDPYQVTISSRNSLKSKIDGAMAQIMLPSREQEKLGYPQDPDEFWEWLNMWGEEAQLKNESEQFKAGYNRAILDAFRRFDLLHRPLGR